MILSLATRDMLLTSRQQLTESTACSVRKQEATTMTDLMHGYKRTRIYCSRRLIILLKRKGVSNGEKEINRVES